MDRSRDAKMADNLLERKNILIAQIMAAFRDLINLGAQPVDNNVSTGQTAYSSMALETTMSEMIKSTEDLLSLTRQIRELWVIGTLRPPAAHDGGSGSDNMVQNAQSVLTMIGALINHQRQSLVSRRDQEDGVFTYVQGDIEGPAQLPPQSRPNQAAIPEDAGTPAGLAGAALVGSDIGSQQQ
ncbi:hypothetical protein VTJ83DRAFT_2806 [Remersonia thermophila]|uniref:Mediator of RNA polymerase II transcription subunit 22 n=1 Tax=Remersonia thermophila TaxID=72144 RepID=A0ABR4DJZ9_9PEZI